MPNGFPCPNPVCTQVFPADAVKGAAALTCPRCGTVYQFRTAPPLASPAAPRPAPPPPPPPSKPAGRTPPAASKPAIPVAKAVPAPRAPVAPLAPVAPVAPLAPEVSPDSPALQLESSPHRLVSTRHKDKRSRRGGWRRWIVPVVILLLVGGAAVGLVYVARDLLSGEGEEEQHKANALGNFAFKPPEGWKPDRDVRMNLHVNLGMKRRKQPSWMGLFYRDYKTRSPSDGELLDVALRKLSGYFSGMEYDDPFQKEDKGRSGSLGGEQAIVFDFEGERDSVGMHGQCVMLTRRGYGYWLFTWRPRDDLNDETRQQWDALRNGFKLLDGRAGWKPIPRKTQELRGESAGIVLKYPVEVWRKEDNPAAYELKPEAALLGFEPVENEETGVKRVDRYAGKAASLQVLVLDKAADLKAGAAAAIEHVRKQLTEIRPSLKMEEVNDRTTGKPVVGTKVGALPGEVHTLRLKTDDEPEKLGVLAVINRPEGLVLIYAEARWERRAYWEQEFKEVLAGVHLKGR
jgi:hypothetical protein